MAKKKPTSSKPGRPVTTGTGYISGGARLAAKGRKPVLLGLTPDEAELIDRARGDTPRTKFITRAAIEAARRETGK